RLSPPWRKRLPWSNDSCRRRSSDVSRRPKHDPEKCGAAFRKDHAQTRDDGSKKVYPALRRQEQGERLVDRALEHLAVGLVAWVSGADAPELDRLYGLDRHQRDRRRHPRELGAAARLQRGEDAVHLAVDRHPRQDDQAVLTLRVGDEIDVARLVGHRYFAMVSELGVDPVRLAEDKDRTAFVPGDVGAIGI